MAALAWQLIRIGHATRSRVAEKPGHRPALGGSVREETVTSVGAEIRPLDLRDFLVLQGIRFHSFRVAGEKGAEIVLKCP